MSSKTFVLHLIGFLQPIGFFNVTEILARMIQQLYYQVCPYCDKKSPENNFCIYCGNILSKVTICPRCYASIPINASRCPFCSNGVSSSQLDNAMNDPSQLNWIFTNFYSAIYVIFLLSAYSLTQLVIGSFFLFLFPADFFSAHFAFFSLIIMLVSSALLIVIITKRLRLSFQKKLLEQNQISILFLLLIILIASASIIEIFVTVIDFGLDWIGVAPSLSSPYDDFFETPLNILFFIILVTTIGPIFEELVFRRFAISLMLKQCQSKFLVVCASALIFSLSHTATDLSIDLRYAILHITATFILGIILAIIFFQWGLKYAIIFHSFWNIFSLIMQLLIINELLMLVDLIVLLFIAITIILTVFSIFQIKRFQDRILSMISLPSIKELELIGANFTLIIVYELILPLIIQSVSENIFTAGFIFFYQFCGFLVGLLLIDREQKMSKNLNRNLRGLKEFNDDTSSLK